MENRLKDYIDMMKGITAPTDLNERVLKNVLKYGQLQPGERCPDLEAIDDFDIDGLQDPAAVVWRRKDGFGVDYCWSADHFAEICSLAQKSGMLVTVCSDGAGIVVISPACQRI